MNRIIYILQEIEGFRPYVFIRNPNIPWLTREALYRSSRPVENFQSYTVNNEGEFTNFRLEFVYD